jgi:phage terminase Nu1 subunit (DNA packaging protein)
VAKEKFADSREEIAEILGVDVRTITNYVRLHSDFPNRVDGKRRRFPIARCVSWKINHDVAAAIAAMAPPAPKDLADAEKRRAIADAEFAELRVMKIRGETVAAGDAAKEVAKAFARVRARFVATPGEFGPRFVNVESLPLAIAQLRDLVSTVLTELQVMPLDDEEEEETSAGSAESGDLEEPSP